MARGSRRRSSVAGRTSGAERSAGLKTSAPPEEERAGARTVALPVASDVPALVACGSHDARRTPAPALSEGEGPRHSAAEAERTSADSTHLGGRPPPHAACAAALEEEAASDASTTASASEPPPESPRVRWADVADSEEEDAAPKAASLAPPWDAATAHVERLARWADLEDSEEEQVPSSSHSHPETMQHGDSASSAMPIDTLDAPAQVMHKSWRGSGGPGQGSAHRSARAEPALDGGSARKAPAWRQQQSAGGRARCDSWGQADRPRHWAPPANGSRGGTSWKQAGWNSASSAAGKLQCQFFIGIEEEPGFQVKQKLLGPHGQNMKRIALKSGAKLRLRGRGSGFLEGPHQEESSDPLMLCVSAPDAWAYGGAVRLLRELVESVHGDFRRFQEQAGQPAPELRLEVHEGPRPGSY